MLAVFTSVIAGVWVAGMLSDEAAVTLVPLGAVPGRGTGIGNAPVIHVRPAWWCT